ncbi:MAG: hypothetical protein P8100_12910, partial [bacterium]
DITSVGADSFTFAGLADEKAVVDMIAFIREKFFSHEGMHVVEHVLLRPRIDEPLFVEVLAPILIEGLAGDGDLLFEKSLPIVSTQISDSSIAVAGDITAEIASNDIRIDGGSFNDGDYIVDSYSFDGTHTVIRTKTSETAILYNLPDGSYPLGDLYFIRKAPITGLTAASNMIVVTESDAQDLSDGDIIEITGSADGTNDKRFVVESVNLNGSDVEITIDGVEVLVRDELLPINIDQDCESCQIKDPYSYIASVILPYWPDRFINLDFRKFMERTLRREAPAHVLLNICWIDCRQMAEFEMMFNRWLVEIGREEIDKVALSQALSDLIDILTRLRNVYPTGTLHDCEADETLEGAIILNNSVLGTF